MEYSHGGAWLENQGSDFSVKRETAPRPGDSYWLSAPLTPIQPAWLSSSRDSPPTTFPTPKFRANSISNQLSDLHVKKTECPKCRGEEHDFTRYFHNTNLFLQPPHAFLRVIETSYILKRHLRNLLLKYCHGPTKDSIESIHLEIHSWAPKVAALAAEVKILTQDSPLVVEALKDTLHWADEMGNLAWEHVADARFERVIKEGNPGHVDVVKVVICKEKIVTLVGAYRKAWEQVWMACMQQNDVLKDGTILFPSQILVRVVELSPEGLAKRD